jgi:starch synthase
VVHVTAEMAPLAKVGGLGDVVSGLSKACVARGHAVEVVLPFYQCVPEGAVQGLTLALEFDCPKGRVQDGAMQHGSLRTQVYTGQVRRRRRARRRVEAQLFVCCFFFL